MNNPNISAVELSKAYRLLNHGPTVLVSSNFEKIENVMAAAWVCVLDFMPPKITVVIDSETKSRELIEKSGYFGIQIPTIKQAELTTKVGTVSYNDDSEKLKKAAAELFYFDDYSVPFVAGCSGWLMCKVIPEPHNQETYDLFIGEVIAAWADNRVFKDGRWHFENADPSLRSIHHVAGGHYYAIGESLPAKLK